MDMDSSSWPDLEHLPSNLRQAIDVLLRGRNKANLLQMLLDGSASPGSDPEELVKEILSSFSNSIALLNKPDSDEEVSHFGACNTHHVGSPISDAGRKSEDSGESSKCTSTLKDRRGCYKRRKTVHSRTQETPSLFDDGYAWRKYGQKSILHAKYPRSYFRCTHKYDQGCQATKQVQRIKEDPELYRTTYYGSHTCKNYLKASPLVMECSDNSDSKSVLINFSAANANNNHNHHPESKQDNLFFQSFQPIKQEQNRNNNSTDQDIPISNPSSSSDYGELMSADEYHQLSPFEGTDVLSGVNSSRTASSNTTNSLDDFSQLMVPVDLDDLQFEF